MLPPLFALLGLATFLDFSNCLYERRWPQLPRWVLVASILILLQGWWQVNYSTFITSSGSESAHRRAVDSMTTTTFLLGAFWALCDLVRNRKLLRMLVYGAIGVGVLVSLIGIVLKLESRDVLALIWTPAEMNWNNFAFYKYHGNAGAFLNLVWPLTLVFARRAFERPTGMPVQLMWALGAIISGLAFFFNASKAALVIALLILPWPFWTSLKQMERSRLALLMIGGLLLIGGASVLSLGMAKETAFQRLTEVSNVSISAQGRWDAYGQYLDYLPNVGLGGIGPGQFSLAFPYQDSPLGNIEEGLREYAHEDYLQTLIEWGWCGALWWALLIFGGLYRAWSVYRRRQEFSSKTDRHLLLGCMIGIGGVLVHALFDFPLQVASIRLFFFLLLAICWSSRSLLGDGNPE